MSMEDFERRKKDHIRHSLSEESQSRAQGDWLKIHLTPEPFPEIDFEDVSLEVTSLGIPWKSPYFVSSMTGGHSESTSINLVLAEACSQKGWMLGVGSQRRELTDADAALEWKKLRQRFPQLRMASNIGLSQLIKTPIESIQRLVENTEASILFIHTNALQECIQQEGTPQFRGGLKAIEKAVKGLRVPVVVKEVGSGISGVAYQRLNELGVAAVDVSGRGGTHWGRIEGLRAPHRSVHHLAAEVFRDWGISTPRALYEISQASGKKSEVWASGGIRNGLQACQSLALGARRVGLAQPLLAAALEGGEALLATMNQFEFELKTAMFCLGIKDLNEFHQRKVWTWLAD